MSQYIILAPGLIDNTEYNEAEIIGLVTWLWSFSPRHGEYSVHQLVDNLFLPIKLQQFILILHNDKPIAYFSWANFDESGEHYYLHHFPQAPHRDSWSSGERMWLIDAVVPFGHHYGVFKLLKRNLFSRHIMRLLPHKNESGWHVKTFLGEGVAPEIAQKWFSENPVCF